MDSEQETQATAVTEGEKPSNVSESSAEIAPDYNDLTVSKLKELLLNRTNNIIFNQKSNFGILKEKLQTLNPNQILNRGYSITFDSSGNVITDSNSVADGELIETKVQKGSIKSRVID